MSYEDEDAERWATELGFRIHGCENCQPYEDGVVWSTDHMSLAELLEETNVPEDLHELIAERLWCKCGSEFDLSTEIAVDSPEVELDEFVGDRFGDWIVEGNQRLNEFVDFLVTSPNSASSQEIGIALLKELKELPTCEVTGN